MSFREKLLKKRENLKKTEVAEKEKLEQLIVKEEGDYDRLIKETYFEVYYNQIEEFTFKSVILPLTIEEIQALHNAHTAFNENKGNVEDLSTISAKINEGIKLIREKTKNQCKIFVRLSSRSPKDAIYHLDKFSCLRDEKLESFQDQNDIFSKLHAFYQASTEVLAVSYGH